MKYVPTEVLEQHAADLLDELGITEAPVPLDLVAHHLGLVVEEVPLGADVSGVLVVADGSGVIGVNSQQPEVRQRFTIAHEIGHFILHRDESSLFIDRSFVAFRNADSAEGERRAEIQANQFAAALLMPIDMVSREIEGETIDLAEANVIEDLARTFGVSSQSMTFRLDNLGLVEML